MRNYQEELMWERACRSAQEETLWRRKEYAMTLSNDPQRLIQAIAEHLEYDDGALRGIAALVCTVAQKPMNTFVFGMDFTPVDYCRHIVDLVIDAAAKREVRDVNPEDEYDALLAAEADRRYEESVGK
jgi:hypothetical protein